MKKLQLDFSWNLIFNLSVESLKIFFYILEKLSSVFKIFTVKKGQRNPRAFWHKIRNKQESNVDFLSLRGIPFIFYFITLAKNPLSKTKA